MLSLASGLLGRAERKVLTVHNFMDMLNNTMVQYVGLWTGRIKEHSFRYAAANYSIQDLKKCEKR